MADPFAYASPDVLVTPGTKGGGAITASADPFIPTRAIHCNVSETITVQFVDDTANTSLVVVAGQCYPYRINKVTVGTGVVPIR